MADEDSIRARIDVDVEKALKSADRLTSKLAELGSMAEGQVARGLSTAEKRSQAIADALVRVSNASAAAAKGLNTQQQAIQGLVQQYNSLKTASGVIDGRGPMAQQNPLLKQRIATIIKEDEQARKSQEGFEAYKKKSDERIAAAEIAAVKETQRVVAAERKEAMARLRADAEQANRIFDQQKKDAQNKAFQSYAPNMPSALKQDQDEAYASYRQNIIAAQELERAQGNIITQRYALYDVATTWGAIGGAILAAAGASAGVAVAYERDFAQVYRILNITEEAAASLKRNLIDLTTELPTSFTEISGIARLGGQLGLEEAADIEAFTSVVARLTATTDLSAEAAGTALGRFRSLLDVAPTEFENLASSILNTGTATVATETQIVNIATQISSMGQFAGLTADQVIGLSGALASVGAQPEISRGTTTRAFTIMSQAVATGGEKLDEFARLSGTSAEEFRKSWGTSDFADTFQAFLSGLSREGNDAIQTLSDLGFESVRDRPLLLRLAGAMDVVQKSFSTAETGFRDATELTEQYNKIADTTAARLQILGNTAKAAMDAIGSGANEGPIKTMLKAVQAMADALLALSRNPVGTWILGITGSVVVLIGTLAMLRSMQALTTASFLAMEQALTTTGSALVRNNGQMRGMIGTMGSMLVGVNRVTAAQNAYNASLTAGTGRLRAWGAAAGVAATGANTLAGGLKAVGKATGWMAALTLGVTALSSFASKNQEARAAVDLLTEALDQNTGAFTENTRAQVFENLRASGALEAAKNGGINLDLMTDAAMGNKDAIAQLTAELEYHKQILADLDNQKALEGTADSYGPVDPEVYDEASANVEAFTKVLEEAGVSTDNLAEAQQVLADRKIANADASQQAADGERDYAAALKETIDAHWGFIDSAIGAQNAMYSLGESLYENGTAFDIYSVGGRANLAALGGVINALVNQAGGDSVQLATLLQGLMDSLVSYGINSASQLGFVTDMIREAMAAAGIATGPSGLPGLTFATDTASNALSQGFSGAAAKAARSVGGGRGGLGKAAKDAAKEIRTLTDYISDLEGVMSDAFDFRFGFQQALDEVSDAYDNMRKHAADAAEAVRDARQAIRDADAEIRGLNAAQGVLKYQLTVAQEYGDTLRANEILADMAENEAKLRKTQSERSKATKDLKKAEDAQKKSLKGNTEGAREQRDMVLDLLDAYQKQITEYANSGASQEQVKRKAAELKREFESQLRQMGYNKNEVREYSKAFDDFIRVIEKVPRNLTVKTTADTTPAERALAEFMAKAKKSSANVKIGGQGTIQGTGINVGRGAITGGSIKVDTGEAKKFYAYEYQAGSKGKRTHTYKAMGGAIEYHATGGVHGLHPGSPRGTDTTPAWLTPGEFVHQKAAVDYYGLPFMNALNNMQIPRYLATGSGPSAGSGHAGPLMVELSPRDRQLLQAAGDVRLILDGRVVAQTVSARNVNAASRGAN